MTAGRQSADRELRLLTSGHLPRADIRAFDFEARKPTFVPLSQGSRIQPPTAARRHLPYDSLVAEFVGLIPPRPALTIMGRTATGATIALQFRMATLIRLPKSKLTMYAGDHNPPHFHVLANDGSEALIDLASLRVIDGTVRPAVFKEALAWASQNVALLATKWKELNP